MTPRWYRTRWFWVGLLGFVLWVVAWVASFAGNRGHVWSWTGSQRYYYASYGAGWIGGGTGKNSSGHPAILRPKGWRHSTWDHSSKGSDRRLPPVQFMITQGNASLWTPYSTLTAAWSIAWLVPLVCWHRPRRVRPPRFPGTPRRWFASPFLWAGLPGFVILVLLWKDSSTHRSSANWKWTRGFKVEPNYLGFGVESNRGEVVIWTGSAYEGIFFRNPKPGVFAERKKSTGDFFQPDAKSRKGARRFQISYLALTGIYLLLWASPAAIWQCRQSGRRRIGVR